MDLESTETEFEDYNDLVGEDDLVNQIEALLSSEIDQEDTNQKEINQNQDEIIEDKQIEEQPLNDNSFVKIKVNGEEKEVTLAELKNGYQRQSDYTVKTQELSQQRQAIEAEKARAQEYIQSLPMLAYTAETNIANAQKQLVSQELVNLAETDPSSYLAHRAKLEADIANNYEFLNSSKQQYAQYQQELNQKFQQQFNEDYNKSNEILAKEYGEAWTKGEMQKQLFDYAIQNGFSPEALNKINDHKIIKFFYKAQQYDDIMGKKDINKKLVEKIPPKVVSSNSNVIDDVENQKNIKKILKSGNNNEIAKLLSKYL